MPRFQLKKLSRIARFNSGSISMDAVLNFSNSVSFMNSISSVLTFNFSQLNRAGADYFYEFCTGIMPKIANIVKYNKKISIFSFSTIVLAEMTKFLLEKRAAQRKDSNRKQDQIEGLNLFQQQVKQLTAEHLITQPKQFLYFVFSHPLSFSALEFYNLTDTKFQPGLFDQITESNKDVIKIFLSSLYANFESLVPPPLEGDHTNRLIAANIRKMHLAVDEDDGDFSVEDISPLTYRTLHALSYSLDKNKEKDARVLPILYFIVGLFTV